MRLLLDAHLSPARLGAGARNAGHDVRAVAEHPELDGASDESLLEIARAEGRILVTHNVRDFIPILRTWAGMNRPHAGCVLIKGIAASEFGLMLTGLAYLFSVHPVQEDWVDLTRWLTPGSVWDFPVPGEPGRP